MKITRLKKRSISVFVIIALLLSCLPLSIFAGEDDIPDIEVPLEPETKITEVVDRREESIKHFKMPDGTYNAISYSGAVHRMNSDGEWIDINNDLSLKTVGSKQLYTTNDSRITFAKAYSSNEDIMTLRENGYAISMALLSNQNDDDDMSMDMNATASLVTVNNSNFSRPESFDTIDEAIEINNKSSISYSNVLADTDIEYVMNGNDIKENIIVKDRAESYVYAFSLSLDGLIPLLDENGAIYLNDEESGDTKYVIPAPYMYDSNDEYSEEVYYELLHVGGDKYLLTVTASSEWINDEERTFPVTVDPTVQSNGWISDTYINSNSVTSNYGTLTKLRLGPKLITMIDMLLPTLQTENSGGVFNNAFLYVNYYGEITYGSTSIGAFKINDAWSESSTNYSNGYSKISTSSIDTTTMTTTEDLYSGKTKVASFDITEAVKPYYNGTGYFYGVALKRISNASTIVVITSSEGNASKIPYIKVNYTPIYNGEYYLQSKETNTFLQIERDATGYNSEYAGMELQRLAPDEGTYQKWEITHIGNGLFSIISCASGKALSIKASEVNTDNARVVQEEYAGRTRQRWKIQKSSSGNCILIPESASIYNTVWCMRAVYDIEQEKYLVKQIEYSDNNSHYDEWLLAKIEKVNYVELEAQTESVWCWTASARMFAKYYSSTFNSSKRQLDAVNKIIETYYTPFDIQIEPEKMAGSISEARAAINYYSDLDVQDNTFANYHYNNICTRQTLIDFLTMGDVVYITREKYAETTSTSTGETYVSGHAFLVYGYVTIDSQIFFLIRDPWPEDIGQTYLMSYQKIYDGRACLDNETPDIYFWDGFIVRNYGDDYSYVLLPPVATQTM